MSTAVGTSIASIALNRQKISAANSKPVANEISRTRASARGRRPTYSHVAMNAKPTTDRNDRVVSTPPCAARMILASTSHMPRAIAAASAGTD